MEIGASLLQGNNGSFYITIFLPVFVFFFLVRGYVATNRKRETKGKGIDEAEKVFCPIGRPSADSPISTLWSKGSHEENQGLELPTMDYEGGQIGSLFVSPNPEGLTQNKNKKTKGADIDKESIQT